LSAQDVEKALQKKQRLSKHLAILGKFQA